jgi:hypothetical protein
MVLLVILLGVYGNIQEDICSPIQKLNIMRKLANGDNASVRKRITNCITK